MDRVVEPIGLQLYKSAHENAGSLNDVEIINPRLRWRRVQFPQRCTQAFRGSHERFAKYGRCRVVRSCQRFPESRIQVYASLEHIRFHERGCLESCLLVPSGIPTWKMVDTEILRREYRE